MKSTQAMRDRIRELMNREQDDYDRAVECVLDDLEMLLNLSRAAQESQCRWFLKFRTCIQRQKPSIHRT